jgi:uncharacterized membrane protein
MVATYAQSQAGDAHFVIRPNSSLSWRGNQLFFVFMVAVSFGVAGAFAAQGMWMVLPFAGFEMLVLGTALYHCCLRNGRQEVISIVGHQVQVAVGREGPERCCTFERCWSRVVLDKAEFRGHPSRLLIRSRGLEVEVGACLADDERLRLASALRAAL